ncbi:hypothetical protein ES706_01813 [subsurface metagenome]
MYVFSNMAKKRLIITVIGLVLLFSFSLIFLFGFNIHPTDVKIIEILHENEDDLLNIDGVIGAGIARDENNYIIGIAVYVEDNMTNIQDIPSELGEFQVFIVRISEASEFEKEKMNKKFS